MRDTIDRYVDKKEDNHNKAFELMGLISAGTFAAVVALGKDEPCFLVMVVMISSIINVWSVVGRLLMGAKLWGKTAAAYIENPNKISFVSVKGSIAVFFIAVISFITSGVAFALFLLTS